MHFYRDLLYLSPFCQARFPVCLFWNPDGNVANKEPTPIGSALHVSASQTDLLVLFLTVYGTLLFISVHQGTKRKAAQQNQISAALYILRLGSHFKRWAHFKCLDHIEKKRPEHIETTTKQMCAVLSSNYRRVCVCMQSLEPAMLNSDWSDVLISFL